MFSPSANEGGPATATRSRRRLRPKSQEQLVAAPKPKRQRVPLSEQTSTNADAQPEMAEVRPEKAATPAEPKKDVGIENAAPVQTVLRKELIVRTKKPKHGDRAAQKGDGSLLLVSCRAPSSFQSLASSHRGLLHHRFQLSNADTSLCNVRQAPMHILLANYQRCPTESGVTGLVRFT
jgi:hypothetical protein